MIKFSAFIITKNEEQRISTAINSLKDIADEIIVVDSGSTDNTVDIAKKLGAKVVFNEWPGYVMQKSFGEKLCRNDWIINIDADEEVTLNLQNEIKMFFLSSKQNDYLACYMDLIILHRNDESPRLWAPYNRVIRLYNKNFCNFSNVKKTTTHDAVAFDENINIENKIYFFKEKAYHRSGTSITQLINKANFYSSEQAKDLRDLNRTPSKIRIFFELPLCFFKAFIIRRYFIFGLDGFVDSLIFAFARFLRIAKAREMRKK